MGGVSKPQHRATRYAAHRHARSLRRVLALLLLGSRATNAAACDLALSSRRVCDLLHSRALSRDRSIGSGCWCLGKMEPKLGSYTVHRTWPRVGDREQIWS